MPQTDKPTSADPSSGSGDSTADTVTSGDATTATGTGTDNGGDFDAEECRVRYLEKGDPRDILRLVDHYTGQPARKDV